MRGLADPPEIGQVIRAILAAIGIGLTIWGTLDLSANPGYAPILIGVGIGCLIASWAAWALLGLLGRE
jgi:hypothetical protein